MTISRKGTASTARGSLVLSLLVAIVGCNGPGSAKAPESTSIKVVALLSTQGKVAAYGRDNMDGVKLAQSDINESGGINGRKLDITYEDTDGNAAVISTLVKRYASDATYVALLGPTTSDEAFAASNVISQLKTPIVMLSVGSTGLWKPNNGEFRDWDFRSTRNDAQVVPPMLAVINAKFKPKRIAVLWHQDFEWSATTLPLFERFCKDNGIDIKTYAGSKSSTDWSAQLTEVKAYEPDLLVMNTVAGVTPKIAVQARDVGIKCRFVGTAAFASPSLWPIAGKAIDGTLVGEIFSPDDPGELVKGFVARFQMAHGTFPPAYAAYGYAGVQLLTAALKQCRDPENRDQLKTALGTLTDTPTVLGKVSYRGKGDITPQNVHILEIKNGQAHELH